MRVKLSPGTIRSPMIGETNSIRSAAANATTF